MKSCCILVTGPDGSARDEIADILRKALEARGFSAADQKKGPDQITRSVWVHDKTYDIDLYAVRTRMGHTEQLIHLSEIKL